MTREQFTAWLANYLNAFPQTREWLNGLPDAQATLRFWLGTLSEVDPDDAEFVTMQLAAGDLPAIAAFDREHTPAIVRRHVKELRARRATRTTASDPIDRFYAPRSAEAISCAQSLGGLLKDLSEGMSREDAMAKWLPPSDAPEKQPRYRCIGCEDSGLRTVWNVFSMVAAKSGSLDRRKAYTAVVRCDCRAGEQQSLMQLAKWDAGKWCEHGGGAFEDESARLIEFMADYEAKKAQRMPNYVKEFDEW